nr:MAG TPA: hypothetical protein [Caudoviricetes sp.]
MLFYGLLHIDEKCKSFEKTFFCVAATDLLRAGF